MNCFKCADTKAMFIGLFLTPWVECLAPAFSHIALDPFYTPGWLEIPCDHCVLMAETISQHNDRDNRASQNPAR